MRSLIAAIVAAGLIGAATPAWADGLVIGGHEVSCPAPIEAGETEILAPVLEGLGWLRAKVTTSGDWATVVAADGTTIRFKAGSTTARVDGKTRRLAAAPKRKGETWLVPVRALAKELGANPRFDEESRTLFLHLRVTDVTVEPAAGGMRVKIAATGALDYSVGALKPVEDRPPRIYVDIEYCDLAGPERAIAVNRGGVTQVRAAQHWLNPDRVRVVLDLRQPQEYRHRTEDEGRTIVLELDAPIREPAALFGVEVGSHGERAAEIRVKAQGPLDATVRADAAGTTLSFVLNNAIPSDPLPEVVGKHSLVKSARLTKGKAAADPVRLEVALARKCAYALAPQGDGLRILVGTLKLSDVHVVLDPGHGGIFPGAQGRRLDEKSVNLDVALRAAKLLRDAGAKVTMTRETDTTLVPIDTTSTETRRDGLRKDLYARVRLAKEVGADVFLSVHCNSSNNVDTHFGSSTWYSGSRNRTLAKTMQASLVKQLGLRDAGIHERGFVVCKYTAMPAALLELAYINNRKEEALLADPAFRDRCAKAVLEGVKEFVEGGGLLGSQVEQARAEAQTETTAESGGSGEDSGGGAGETLGPEGEGG